MHCLTRPIAGLILLSLTFLGSGCSKNLLKTLPPTLDQVKSAKGYVHQVAAVLTLPPADTVGTAAGQLYFSSLIKAVRAEDGRSRLLTLQDSDFPEFLAALAVSPRKAIDSAALCAKGRAAGYQGLLVASLDDIHIATKRVGFFWFRNTRYYMHFHVTADLYDPYTGAKVLSLVEESATRIDEDDYESYNMGMTSSFEQLDEEIEDVAEDLGETVGEALEDLQWKTAVVAVEGDRLILPAGRRSGMTVGDQLTLFEGRQLEAQQGRKFVIPGFKVAEARVTRVDEQAAEAQVQGSEAVHIGDIAVPVR